jgi:uncharacterized protein
MKTLSDIQKTLATHRQLLYEKYPIQSMAIFGSYARKEQNDQSDLDLMVEFSGKIGIRFVDLADEIEKLIGLKVDLVSRKGIKEKYFKAIQSDLIYV